MMSVLLYEKKGRIAYITLNRPEKRNALNYELLGELEKAWIDFRDDDDLWVAVGWPSLPEPGPRSAPGSTSKSGRHRDHS